MNFIRLPNYYEPIKKIDLREDKKATIVIRILSAVAVAVMLVLGGVLYGENALKSLLLTEKSSELYNLIGRVLLIIFFCFLYIQLREGINILLMKLFCKKARIKMNFRLFFTDATSTAFYNRRTYIFISIVPFLIFALLLAVIVSLVPFEWFWTVYIVQIVNFASAVGDMAVLFILLRMPKDILIRDSGTEIEVFGLRKSYNDFKR